MQIGGSNNAYGTFDGSSEGIVFNCSVPASDGSFTVPPGVLLELPSTRNIPGTDIVTPGSLGITGVSTQTFPPPTGVDALTITSQSGSGVAVTYQ